MNADDPAVREVMRRSMVARIATLSRDGRPSINPLYFVYRNGRIWLGTVDWTLAARNVKADPRVSILFEVEQETSNQRILRIKGRKYSVNPSRGLREWWALVAGGYQFGVARMCR